MRGAAAKASPKRACGSRMLQTRNQVIYPCPSVEKLLDEVRVGVKGQSNLEIARTPRNAFRCSLGRFLHEVERLIGCEGFTAYQVQTNSECVQGKSPGVRARVLRSVPERRRIQTIV